MNNIYRFLLFALCAFTCIYPFSSFASGTNWVEVKNDRNIVVMQRNVTGENYKETSGVMRTPGAMFAILAVLKDSESCSDWLYKCKHGETIQKINAAERVYYTVIDAPLLMKDRDMFIRSSITYHAQEKRIDIQLAGVHDFAPPRKGKVRVLDLRGFWTLQEQDNGEVEMTYQIYSNPRVGPASAANSTMVSSVFDTLENVARLAQSKKYAGTSFSEEEIKSISAVH